MRHRRFTDRRAGSDLSAQFVHGCKKLLQEFRSLTEDPKNLDLMRTLQIYLENNLNYSITAQKQFLHINTVRNRIDRMQSLVDIDWENAVDRLRIEILLRFLELE